MCRRGRFVFGARPHRALFPLFVLVLALSARPTEARPFNSFESEGNAEQAKEKVLKLLDRIDPNGFRPIDQTFGFRYAWTSRWLSPYNYTIYIGEISTQKPVPILRVEGNAADVITFSRIFTYEKVVRSEPDADLTYEKPGPKYHIVGQGLNLIQPAFGIMYASYNSPSLTMGQTFWRSLTYILVDGILVSAVGTKFYRHRFAVSNNAGGIAAAVVLTRIAGAYQNQALIRGHNTVAEAGYTFSLESY